MKTPVVMCYACGEMKDWATSRLEFVRMGGKEIDVQRCAECCEGLQQKQRDEQSDNARRFREAQGV